MNKKTLAIVFGIFALVIVTTAASFAFFTYSRVGNTTSTIISGDIEFSYIEGDSAELTNAFPVKDSIGAIDEAGQYTFQVKLNASGTTSANYNVYLVDNNKSTNHFTNEQIKFALVKNDVFVANTSSTEGVKLSAIEGFDEGTYNGEGIILEEQEITAGKVDNYKLRIWISDDVSYNNQYSSDGTMVGIYNNYTYSLKVKVTSEATVGGSITIKDVKVNQVGVMSATIGDKNGLDSYAFTKTNDIPADDSDEWIKVTSELAKSNNVRRMSSDNIKSKKVSFQAKEIGTYYLHVKNKAGIIKTVSKQVKSIKEAYDGESILDILSNDDILPGVYKLSANNVMYSTHVYVLDGDQHFTENQKFGDENDVATANTYAQNMVIVKVNGDLTIDSGVTVYPHYNSYGGPKGFVLYVTGKLTNNGTIDNSHGAKAEGQDVYLWKNSDGTYEYVPATGGLGAARPALGGAGKSGTSGNGRQTGGGGSGTSSTNYSNSAGAGTSYSGGAGGGASCTGGPVSGAGASLGGAGGFGASGNSSKKAGTGAGNPAGGCNQSGYCVSGSNGTGGLLILYANEYENKGTISATGANGGNALCGGGSSGGGSINIFTNQDTGIDQLGIITDTRYNEILGNAPKNGGASVGTYADSKGGSGGTGTLNIGEIRNGQYYDLKEIIEQDKDAYIESVTKRGDSIISILQKSDLKSGYYDFQVKTEEELAIYSTHVYVLDGDQHFTENQKFGDENDVATANTYAQNMVIVKVNGDLTIDSGVTVYPHYNSYGGPKGFVLYVTGKLENNGTIDNSHGAKAEGQDVYLWKNSDGTYEYVPATGGLGAARPALGGAGKSGTSGNGRQTGGGGSGTSSTNYSNSAGAGTSYSGGAGGGASCTGGPVSGAGASLGGAGGFGASGNSSKKAGTGAGNPAGGCNQSGYCVSGSNGTGGLLILYANEYENKGTISATGANGGNALCGGGSSGGGSINIFYTASYVSGTVRRNGGASVGTYADSKGGAGGNGTVTYTQIEK